MISPTIPSCVESDTIRTTDSTSSHCGLVDDALDEHDLEL